MSTEISLADSFHLESHAPLLTHPSGYCRSDLDEPEPARRLDAIVVPTIRPWSLGPAIALASETGAVLVVLCSTDDQAAHAWHACGMPVDEILVTHVPPAAGGNHLAFLAAGHPEHDTEPSCHADIARKRNIGLLLARLCGWRTVMFLDDDITGMTASGIAAACALTTHCQAAGFRIGHYPDNSVVCHAHRLAGGHQEVFPGGSALLIDVDRNDTLFPPIYNEDWLFLFDAVQSRSVTMAGTLAQREYSPFAQPRRAATEEFGDVIAEGLYRLLHEGGSIVDANRAYWRRTLARRFELIDDIADRLFGREPTTNNGAALMSLTAARKRLAGITELACLSFVQAWRTDVDLWRAALDGLPVMADLAGAAKYLDLPTADKWVRQ